jgi:cytochrome c peroxidase
MRSSWRMGALAAVTALGATAALIALLAPPAPAWATTPAPVITDFADRPSHDGLFRAEVVAVSGPLAVGRRADWRVRVQAADGSAMVGAAVWAAVGHVEDDGPLRPVRVASSVRGGEFVLRRVRPDRAGWWNVKLEIRSTLGTDSLAFNVVIPAGPGPSRVAWSDREVETLRSLWIGSLPPVPADPSNRWADDPAAVAFGHRLFFEPRLSSTGRVSCATCHLPDREFQDDVPLGVGVGRTDRRTMPVAGTAYSPFLFWDGRKDSQWAQALGPLESPVEHGGTRALYAHVVAEHHRAEYETIFGPMPDLTGIPRVAGPVDEPAARAAWDALTARQQDAVTGVYVNLGKAIAAYQRRLQPGPSRFDRYVETILADGRAPADVLSDDEVAGLRLFMGRANCLDCHNGPLLTNQEFHNTGIPAVKGLPEDVGRAAGAPAVLADEFNCRSRWSDADAESCSELEFMVAEGHELVRAFKVPSLRNVADRPPYMHAGQVATLADAIAHYDRAPKAPAGHTELRRLRLSARERAQLEAYLRTLSGGTDAPAELLAPPPAVAGRN